MADKFLGFDSDGDAMVSYEGKVYHLCDHDSVVRVFADGGEEYLHLKMTEKKIKTLCVIAFPFWIPHCEIT